jgi:hypothetical protein
MSREEKLLNLTAFDRSKYNFHTLGRIRYSTHHPSSREECKGLFCEDPTVLSTPSMAGEVYGKLLSLLGTTKTLIMLGCFHTDFNPEALNQVLWTNIHNS